MFQPGSFVKHLPSNSLGFVDEVVDCWEAGDSLSVETTDGDHILVYASECEAVG